MRTSENIYVVVVAVLGLGIAMVFDKLGMSQKWHAAIVGTLISFGGVAWVFKARWARWQFWVALAICLILHLFCIWLIFSQILVNVEKLGILVWAPVAFVEGCVLLALVPVLERRLIRT